MNKIKKVNILILITLLILLFSSFVNATAFDNLNLESESIVLIDSNSGKILFDKNGDKKMYPASITKILTAIIVIENSNLTDTIEASYTAITSLPNGYSTANIKVSEKLTIDELLNLFLIRSANEVRINVC